MQRVRSLPNVHERSIHWRRFGRLSTPCDDPEAMVEHRDRDTEAFSLIARQARPIDSQTPSECLLRLAATCGEK